MCESLKYQRNLELDSGSSGAKLVTIVEPGSRVLEVGPGSGFMTRYMKHHLGCHVDAVELAPEYGEIVAQWCEKVVVGNIETLCLSEHFNLNEYDYIIFADVLEHLVDPWKTLRDVKSLLKVGGKIVASIPNISHFALTLELLLGRFQYRELGLLDRTHLRFFTRNTVEELFCSTGFCVTAWDRTVVNPVSSEFHISLADLSASTRALIELNKDWDTYQFLVTAQRQEDCKPSKDTKGEPAVDFTRERLFQVFWDDGRGYSEQRAVTRAIKEKELTSVEFDISSLDGPIRSIRIDPIDSDDFFEICSLRICDEKEETLFDYQVQDNRLKISFRNIEMLLTEDKSRFLSLKDDPQILVDGFAEVVPNISSLKLHFEFKLYPRTMFIELLKDQISLLVNKSDGVDSQGGNAKREKVFVEELGRIERSVKDLELKASETKSHVKTLENYIKTLETTNEQSSSHIAKIEEYNSALQKQVLRLEVESKKNATNSSLYQSLANSHFSLSDQLATERKQFRREKRALEKRIEQLGKIAELQPVIAALETSLSWKITAPLRSLSRVSKQLKQMRYFKPLKPLYWLLTLQWKRIAYRLRSYWARKRLASTLKNIAPLEKQVANSGLFDAPFYSEKNATCTATGLSPLQHFILHGAAENRDPHVLFSVSYYRSQAGSDLGERQNPVVHYIEKGVLLGLKPHPLFDTAYYMNMHAEVKSSGINPLVHFLTRGWKQGFNPNPFFDLSYYLKRNPDIAASKVNPLCHYAQFGWKEDREVHPEFSSSDYKRLYSDVGKSGLVPLQHFLDYGSKELRLGQFPALDYGQYLPTGKDREKEQTVKRGIDVVIPVYRGLGETKACIESVLGARCKNEYRLVVINDCSPEPELESYLKSLPKNNRLLVLHNEYNLGFVGTVNRGMANAGGRDVILLNSDTLVYDYWLDILGEHAYAKGERVGTVTPLSNNATICSYPTFEGSENLPGELSLCELNNLVIKANRGKHVVVPTGVGFCFYIRRECLDEVGLFDQEAFGKGYGEENDFCFRASKKGWQNVLAGDVFVYHRGEVSFKDQSMPRKDNALAILSSRYPNYIAAVSRFVKEDPARGMRAALTAARYKTSSLSVTLIIEHCLGGGTQKHTEEFIEQLSEKSRFLVLRPILKNKRRNLLLFSADRKDNFSVELNSEQDFGFLVDLLQSFGVEHVHIHHLFGMALDVKRLIRELDVPYYVTLHDYFFVCPQNNLLTVNCEYCGEPSESGCNECLAQRPRHGATDIIFWRKSYETLLKGANAVICPSVDVALRINRYVEGANTVVVPHEPSNYVIEGKVKAPRRVGRADVLKVAIIGVLAPLKGLSKAQDVALQLTKAKSNVSFYLIGTKQGEMEYAPGCSFYELGKYDDSNLDELIEKINPDVIWFPADWPETYSYTLSAALRSRLPIIAPRLGAFVERLENRTFTWFVRPNASGQEIAELLLSIRKGELPATNTGAKTPMIDVNANIIKPGFYEQDYFRKGWLKAENKKGKIKIALLLDYAGDVPNGCAYVRLLLPFCHPTLGDAIEVEIVRKEELYKIKADVLIVQRVAICERKDAELLLSFIKSRGIKLVYELDDDLVEFPEEHPEYEFYKEKCETVKTIVQAADQVWVSTSYLKEKLSQYSNNVVLIENVLDERLWFGPKPSFCPGAWGSFPLRILYMGTLTHSADFGMIRTVIDEIGQRHAGEVVFDIAGVVNGIKNERYLKVLPLTAEAKRSYPGFVNWMRINNKHEIGIAPLVDSDFSRSKSALKFFDYSALGLASVCSDVESYKATVRDKVDGLLAKNDEQSWYKAICSLIDNSRFRAKLRIAAYERALSTQTLKERGFVRLELLEKLLEK